MSVGGLGDEEKSFDMLKDLEAKGQRWFSHWEIFLESFPGIFNRQILNSLRDYSFLYF